MTTVEPIDLNRLDLESFRGRPVTVLGLARSGLALTRFLADRGADVTAYDARRRDDLGEQVEALGDLDHVRLLLGPEIDPAEALRGSAMVTTSPSIGSHFPTTEPRLRDALAQVEADGVVPVVSEVDLFLRLCPAPVVGVTGTKGKTTTSALTAAVLGASGRNTLLGGNIGVPLVERLPELDADARVVLELSELQLPTLSRGTLVATYTHVTADHLDRHGTLEAYQRVKHRLFELVPEDGAVILNAEDPVVSGYGEPPSGAHTVRYRRSEPLPGEVGVVDDWVVAREIPRLEVAGVASDGRSLPGRQDAGVSRAAAPSAAEQSILPLSEIAIPGWHTVSNVLAAVAAGLLFGVAPDGIRAAVSGFRGVEHRLELVAESDGVRYVNDSMGTQPDAVIAALRSYPRPLVMIAGGRAKDLAIDALAQVVAERADAAVLIGESGPMLGEAFRAAGLGYTEVASDMQQAVAQADSLVRARLAHAPAATIGTVLLSPAAASFDMYVDYAARGRAFRDAVTELLQQRKPRP
jgi:UDP-N-acetylmuramoylalanine--D-glutamate ligase